MDLTPLLLFCALSATSILVPGPNFLLVVRAALTGGRAAADATVLGIGIASLAWGLFAVFGLRTAVENAPLVFVFVKLAGAAWILYIGLDLFAGWSVTRASRSSGSPNGATRSRNAFLEALFTCTLNPNIGLFFVAVFPQFIDPASDSTAEGLALVVVHVLLTLTWFTLLGRLTGTRWAATRGSSRVRRYGVKAAGVAMVGFGVTFALAI